jgi:hypothetical protein
MNTDLMTSEQKMQYEMQQENYKQQCEIQKMQQELYDKQSKQQFQQECRKTALQIASSNKPHETAELRAGLQSLPKPAYDLIAEAAIIYQWLIKIEA